MIRTLLVDDEAHCIATLRWHIEVYCPQVQIIDTYSSGAEGLTGICTHQPDLVFLDIAMPQMSGFDMLQRLAVIDFHVIFTTDYDLRVIHAIRFSALDYIIKPIDKEE
ncbi:hypothetical protein GCM10023189_52050 [Nibrella saemangeumensis]|uniref:Response regulatory domain-containing protein n=1 Tax=Nibrella saemangeumensis TaxID=1084526 RepID=A0ABP8NIF1_9BACT